MKIALLSSSYHPYYKGGGEYSVKRLADGLLEQGKDIFVISAFNQNATETIDGILVYRIKHPNIYWSFESEQKPAHQKLLWHMIEGYNPSVTSPIVKILKREKPDILHIRNVEDFSPYVCKVAKQFRIPVVVTLNSFTWLCPKATMFRNGSNCSRQCLDCKLITYPKKYLSKHVDAIVGVSRFMIDVHTAYHYFPKARKEVIYTSADLHVLDLPVHQNGFITFGYIGRLHPTKGVHQIIETFVSLPISGKLIIAGEGPADYVKQCKELAAKHANVVFLGKYEAKAFYEQVDVVLISSLWHEPFPRVLVEAYSFGRSVIASSTGGTSEMVIHEKTGYVFDPDELEQVKSFMLKFLQMKAEALQDMQENIKHFFLENFKDEVQMYTNLYSSLRS